MVNFRELLQDEKAARFAEQDPATGNFDVIFQLGDKLLYANRCMFVGHSKLLESQTLAVMKSNEAQTVVSQFQYEEFYQLMFFLYSGKCDVTPENAVRLMEVAHFYSVDIFKMYLEEIIREWEFNWDTVFQYLAAAKEYSMNTVIYHLSRAVFEKLEEMEYPHNILGVSNTVGCEIVEFAEKEGYLHFDLFKFVFRWAIKKSLAANRADSNKSVLQTFKINFSEIAPSMTKYGSLHYEYIQFAVNNSNGLFSQNHLSRLLIAFGYSAQEVLVALDAFAAFAMSQF